MKYSLLRPRDLTVGAGTLNAFRNWFTSIETPDKSTVIITTESPQPGFFDALELFNMVDKDNVEGPDARSTVVGTGPFKFVDWVKCDHFTLRRTQTTGKVGPYFDSVIT